MQFNLEAFYEHNRRLLTWVIFFGLLWLMRGFFGLIFLTFVLAFVATPLAALGQRYLRLPRRASFVVVYLFFLGALTAFTSLAVPRVVREANTLIKNIDQIEANVMDVKSKLEVNYPTLGRAITAYLRGLVEDEQQGAEAPKKDLETPAALPAPSGSTESTESTESTGQQRELSEDEILLRKFIAQKGALVRKDAPSVLSAVGKSTLTMLLALLFSFLISMDIARLAREIESLRLSRLHDFYEQTAQPVVRFAWVVGKSIQAQAMIACVNTLLTLIGLVILGVPNLTVLSFIVFLCSFIPVLGVFISTVPTVLVALNGGGISTALAVVGLVILIHIIEAYLLNPLIYGHHLKLNPVLVLIILYVGHHAFGIWGMLLGVPVTYYFIHDVFGVPLWEEKQKKKEAAPAESQP